MNILCCHACHDRAHVICSHETKREQDEVYLPAVSLYVGHLLVSAILYPIASKVILIVTAKVALSLYCSLMSYSQITTQRCTAQDSAFNHSHNFIVISSFMGDAPLLIFITEWLLTYVYIRAPRYDRKGSV